MSTGLLIVQSLHDFVWNGFIIYQFCIFVHGKLFAVAFKIFASVIHRNVMSIFKSLYVSMLGIVL